jgi:hypothetical protein
MKTRKCKYCRQQFQPYTTLQKNCFDPNCVTEWINDVKQKNWQKKKAKLKLDLMTVQDYIKIAQQVFNKYIRLRDAGNLCISCQKKPLKENAGHFYNANNHWNVRFDERNVHLQCEHCNTYLSGNLIEYRKQLINKIGIEQLTLLELEANKTRKFTIDELKQIINKYKLKIKQNGN